MRILIISDTHRKMKNFDILMDRVGKIDMLIHLGDIEGSEKHILEKADCEVHMIAGNNDFFSHLPKEKEIMIGKYRCLLTHGHNYYVSAGSDLIRKESRGRGMDIVMYGHTHRPLIEIDDDLMVVNPGSLSFPRQDDRKASFIMMDIDRFGDAHFSVDYI